MESRAGRDLWLPPHCPVCSWLMAHGNTPEEWFSTQGSSSPGDIGQHLETFLVVTTRGLVMLLASGERKPGTLLSSSSPPRKGPSAKLRNPAGEADPGQRGLPVPSRITPTRPNIAS